MTVTTPAQDLAARWHPSTQQMADAAERFAQAPNLPRVFTIHVLVDKHHSVWTPDVQVRPIEGQVYNDRDRALGEAATAARVARAVLPGTPVTSGWTAHYPDGAWAVFEA